jgi:hypothetical protein
MTTLTLQLELPDNFVISEHEAKTAIVTKLYEDGKLSIGKSAELLGMTKRKFIETFGTVCGVTPEELDRELENARRASQHIETKKLKKEKSISFSGLDNQNILSSQIDENLMSDVFGRWQSNQSAEEIIRDIYESRTISKEQERL